MTTITNRKKRREKKNKAEPNTERKALVESFFGSMPWLKLTVNDYLREKYAETDAENES